MQEIMIITNQLILDYSFFFVGGIGRLELIDLSAEYLMNNTCV